MKHKKPIVWVAFVLSVPATFNTGMSVIFYSWLNATKPVRWPTEKTAVWACGSLILAIKLFSVFVYCVVSLAKMANKIYREQEIQCRLPDAGPYKAGPALVGRVIQVMRIAIIQ